MGDAVLNVLALHDFLIPSFIIYMLLGYEQAWQILRYIMGSDGPAIWNDNEDVNELLESWSTKFKQQQVL